jgi:hypothetical protein
VIGADSAQGEGFGMDDEIEANSARHLEASCVPDIPPHPLEELFGGYDNLLKECGISAPFIQSRPLDLNVWASYPALTSVLDRLTREIDGSRPRKRKRKRTEAEAARFKDALRIILLSLYVAWKADPDLQVGINLNATWYGKENADRYRDSSFTYRQVKAAHDGLERLGYLQIDKRGNCNRENRTGYNTKIRATDKLIALLVNEAQIEDHRITRRPGAEIIILKEEKDADDYARCLPYADTDLTNAMRENLRLINSVLEAHNVALAVTPQELSILRQRLKQDPKKGPLDFNKRTLRRIFNNGKFDEGGRFYGSWWQQIPNDSEKGTAYRQFITIDGEPTVEMDYSGCHPRMLYAEIGQAFPGDPYQVGQPTYCRDVVKQTLNKMLNAGKGGLEEPEEYDETVMGMRFQELTERIMAKHEPIARYFFTGTGLRLQYRDASIAEKVMMHFAKQDIPCLCIHDSFIVQRRYANELETVMKEVALEELGVELPIKGSEQCVYLGVGE